jgi:N-hydroxyarylamine O-acetyltransferase
MKSAASAGILEAKLLGQILIRMGLKQTPATDNSGMETVYRAWCRHVPFDNVRKMIALGEGTAGPLPGSDVNDYFENWLTHGTGGTCWSSSNALYLLLRSLGFNARRVAGNMRDMGKTTHASVIVLIDGHEWLLDASLQIFQPIPLRPEIFASGDPVHPTECEPVPEGYLVWWLVPPGEDFIPCRIFPQERTEQFYLDSYERSRNFGPFNQRLYAARSTPEYKLVLHGNTRVVRSAAGMEARELSRDELCQALHEDIGLSEELVARWVRSGALESTMQPATGPRPDANPNPAKPPSLR